MTNTSAPFGLDATCDSRSTSRRRSTQPDPNRPERGARQAVAGESISPAPAVDRFAGIERRLAAVQADQEALKAAIGRLEKR